MAKRKRTVGFLAFLKGNTDPAAGMPGCANFDHHYGGCLFCWRGCHVSNEVCLACTDFELYTFCKVEEGQRCGYFERAVLPTAADIGLKDVVYALYEENVGIAGNGLLKRGQIRRCPDCGDEVGPRQRYCQKCSKRRRRESYRRAREKQRLMRNN